METLYHYCSVESFFAILSSQRLRLSDAAHMNDSHECAWSDEVLARLLTDIASSLPNDDIQLIRSGYRMNRPHPFIFCLSEEPDLLSQWRGYAADGTGVSIGFSVAALPKHDHLPSTNSVASMNTALWQIIYNPDAQLSEMKSRFQAVVDGQAFQNAPLYDVLGAHLTGYAPLMKNPAFGQEKEWRLIHTPMLIKKENNKYLQIGTEFNMKQSVIGNEIRTYFDYPFPVPAPQFVKEVWLGPKCKLSDFDLSLFLSLNGYEALPVLRSSATYR